MNHYLIVFGGAFIGMGLTILVFKYCLGPLLELLNRRQDENVQPVPHRISAKKSRFRPEIERFVHEEFESSNHAVVFVAMSNLELCIGIAVFMQERRVEYFLEKFPQCCVSLVDSDRMLKFRSGLAALSFWGVQFTLGNRVQMLSDYRLFVEMANSNGDIIKEKITAFEDRYDFKLLCHWTDNYICDMVMSSYVLVSRVIFYSKNLSAGLLYKNVGKCGYYSRTACIRG